MSNCGTVTNQEIINLLFIIAPQFVTTDPTELAQINALIDALECMINCQLLGCCAALAYANLLAHYLTMQGNPYLGTASNLSEGQLSIGLSSGSSGGNNGFYSTSPYGMAYQSIVGKFKVGAYVTNTGPTWRGPECGC